MSRIWVICGSGGVGKTTVAAALAVALAGLGRTVALLTVDPAQRLADALGLPLANGWTTLPLLCPGRVDAAMLDRRSAWEDLVRRELGDEAEGLLAHPIAQAVGTRLGGSHEYLALERLERTASAGTWQDIVVDTPPASHALELLRGPARLRRAFDPAVMGALRASTSFARRGLGVVARVAGSELFSEIGGFFSLAGALAPVLRTRGAGAARLLRSDATRALWVARPDSEDLVALDAFRAALVPLGVRAGAVVANRTESRPAHSEVLASDPPPPRGISAETWGPWCSAVRGHLRLADARGERCERGVRRMAAVSGLPVWPLPEVGLEGLAGIQRLGCHLAAPLRAWPTESANPHL